MKQTKKRVKRSKGKIFFVEYHIYPFDVLVCLGVTPEAIVKWIDKEKLHLSEDDRICILNPSSSANGRTMQLSHGNVILWMPKMPQKGDAVLAHEVYHAISFLMEKVGMKWHDASDEAFAYPIGYLTKEINKML